MLKGILLKGYAGFYYVYAQDRVWECSLRGRFRVKKQDFLPGDKVTVLPGKGNQATIEKVEERKNSLIRPPVANIDQVLIVFAMLSPQPDLNLLDRLLVQASWVGIDMHIVFTKSDLLVSNEVDVPLEYYRNIGYNVLEVSNKTGQGIDKVAEIIKDRISVLAGPSGVGKSSLLNSLNPDMSLKTGEVSTKLGRGKHTTRHVELLRICGGLVADTPGFSSLHMPSLRREDLQYYFPEFEDFRGECRFNSCLHNQEPDCAIKTAVDSGEILFSRYDNYLQFLKEVIENERRY